MTREELIRYKDNYGYSTAQLSELSGVPIGTLTKILSGQTKNPRIDTMQALEDFFKNKTGHSGDLHLYQNLSVQGCSLSKKTPGAFPQASPRRYDASFTPMMVAERAVQYGAPIKKQGNYTTEDMEALPEGRLFELIDGVLYDMASPSYTHQKIAESVFIRIWNQINRHKGACQVSLGPVDVHPDPEDDLTVVIPDLFIVCDRDKIRKDGIYGAPDFILEVLSPSTAQKDKITKTSKYLNAGVREYWIIDPVKKQLIVYEFEVPMTYVLPLAGSRGIGIFGGEPQIDLDELAGLAQQFNS